MRPRSILIVLTLVLALKSSARADEEYDQLTARLQAEMKKFYDEQDEAAKKVGWTNRSLPPTPEQSRAFFALLTRRDSPRINFHDEFLAYAEKHKGTPDAIEAWAMVMTTTRCSGSDDGFIELSGTTLAFERLANDHADHPDIVKAMDVIQREGRCLRFESLEFLYKTIECKNKDPEIVARARWARAEMFQRPLNFQGRFRMTRMTETEKASNEAAYHEILCGLVRDFPQTRAGKYAEDELFRRKNLAIGRELADFEGKDFSGQLIRLSQYRGRVVMLVFWASWCGPCMQRIPEEREMAEKFADKPFTILGVNCDRTRAAFRKVMAKEALPWPNIFDGDPKTGPIVNSMRIKGFPTVLLLDHEGVIRHQDLYGETLEAAIAELIKKVPAKAHADSRPSD